MMPRFRTTLFVTLLLACITPLALRLCAEQPKLRTMHEKEADAALGDLWKVVLQASADSSVMGKPLDWQMKMTTWLPSEWPPSPQTVWTRYAYGLDVTLDGSSGVSAPFARVERQTGENRSVTLIPMAAKLKRIATHPVRPKGGWKYTLDDEKRMLARALTLTSPPPDEPRGTLGLAAYFHSWRLGNAEIAVHVASRHRNFFQWLDAQRP